MFMYVTILGFLAFALYACTFVYAIINKNGQAKQNGKRALIGFLIMAVGLIGMQVS
ncbi:MULTISPECIES: hypothetical protein [Bacillaceae]|uniref:hypothetical protein n=1 Tax=Bacillaceae TaxID=186817 RepID=UPI0014043AC8|nr:MULTISPECIES: hypothetical protein [Bacillaceae]MDT2045952.1 hypothetical protein [Priestia flexa]